MLLNSFDVITLYSLISVFEPSLEDPHNDWSDQQVLQGFSWRQECPSFGMLNSCTLTSVEIWKMLNFEMKEDTVRAIQVPFTVISTQGVTVQGIPTEPDTNLIPILPGSYALIFETGFKEEYRDDPEYQGRLVVLLPTWCRFTFIPKKSQEVVEAEILRADSNLSPTYPLLMEADPA
jgi:Competence protein J (ComJ)